MTLDSLHSDSTCLTNNAIDTNNSDDEFGFVNIDSSNSEEIINGSSETPSAAAPMATAIDASDGAAANNVMGGQSDVGHNHNSNNQNLGRGRGVLRTTQANDIDSRAPNGNKMNEAEMKILKVKAEDTISYESKEASGDSRFVCAICLECVSDEPVVTRCGHLYCWPCLYRWLEPGMLLSEYHAAFRISSPETDYGNYNGDNNVAANGSTANDDMNSNNSAAHSSQRISRGLNQLLSLHNTHNNYYGNYSAGINGERVNEQRRCCPVCKASCTVDSVIPIYVNVQNIGNLKPAAAPTLTTASETTIESSVTNEGHAASTAALPTATQSERVLSTPVASPAHSPRTPRTQNQPTHASPNESSLNSRSLADSEAPQFPLDPYSASLGLRQRRPASSTTNSASGTTVSAADIATADNNSENNTTDSAQNTRSDTSHNRSRIYNQNTIMTPVHRNGMNRENYEEVDNNSDVGTRMIAENAHSISSSVPSRPLPSSPFTTNSQSSRLHPQTQTQYPSTSSSYRSGLPRRATTAPSASPFRVGIHGRNMRSRQREALTRHGRLTSVLMEIVGDIENLASSHQASHNGESSDGGQGNSPSVPPLHRTDGGLGGIGRATEFPQNNLNQPHQNRQQQPRYNPMTGEEPSLTDAREFLSRLLLMLACFVVLCLLLF